MTFYEVFSELSAKRDMLPTQAAAKIGISQSLPTKWKNNPDRIPRADVCVKIASFFGISVADMLSRIDGCAIPAAESDMAQVMRIADTLSEDELFELQSAIMQRLQTIRQNKK